LRTLKTLTKLLQNNSWYRRYHPFHPRFLPRPCTRRHETVVPLQLGEMASLFD